MGGGTGFHWPLFSRPLPFSPRSLEFFILNLLLFQTGYGQMNYFSHEWWSLGHGVTVKVYGRIASANAIDTLHSRLCQTASSIGPWWICPLAKGWLVRVLCRWLSRALLVPLSRTSEKGSAFFGMSPYWLLVTINFFYDNNKNNWDDK